MEREPLLEPGSHNAESADSGGASAGASATPRGVDWQLRPATNPALLPSPHRNTLNTRQGVVTPVLLNIMVWSRLPRLMLGPPVRLLESVCQQWLERCKQ